MRAARSRAQKAAKFQKQRRPNRIASAAYENRVGWIPRGEKERFGVDWIARRPGQNKAVALEQSKRATLGPRGSGAKRGRRRRVRSPCRRLGGACARLLRRRNWIATNGGGGSREESGGIYGCVLIVGRGKRDGTILFSFYLFLFLFIFFFAGTRLAFTIRA